MTWPYRLERLDVDVERAGPERVVGAVVQRPGAQHGARVVEVLGQRVHQLAQRRHLAHAEIPTNQSKHSYRAIFVIYIFFL